MPVNSGFTRRRTREAAGFYDGDQDLDPTQQPAIEGHRELEI